MSKPPDPLTLFTPEEIWYGGLYELAIELGDRNNARLEKALQAFCKHADLGGWYGDRNVEPQQQASIVPTLSLFEERSSLYGIAALPGGKRVACSLFMVRELNPEASDAGGLDWIGLSIPMGALNTVYGVGGFPFGDSPSETWRGPLDDWLARIGKSVFAEVAFPLALVGHEVSGATYYEDIQRDGLPPERWFGYLLADNNGLEWFPPTIYEPPMQFP